MSEAELAIVRQLIELINELMLEIAGLRDDIKRLELL